MKLLAGTVILVQGFLKKTVPAKAVDRLEIALAETQQADVPAYDIRMGNGRLFQRKFFNLS
ncbi:hypothetical protein [Trichloromonas sp.]|uniref:hypothetical protein n=1 Tax=Trichloromonas sp. TaxID=3069249 RepID=UPI002A3C23D2|nr:hypothetical protein [Trichloromonas sp.]